MSLVKKYSLYNELFLFNSKTQSEGAPDKKTHFCIWGSFATVDLDQ